jgi:hypothetical protein
MPRIVLQGTLAVCLMVSLSGCSASGGKGIECAGFIPVYISGKDVLTDGTGRMILQNNEVGAELCGWKPNV